MDEAVQPTLDAPQQPLTEGEQSLKEGLEHKADAVSGIAQARANLSQVGEGASVNNLGEVETPGDRAHDLTYRQEHGGLSSTEPNR